MSRETLTHLNTHTLIGHTAHRGTAWHYRAEEQGQESNHYPGAIPVADVERRLFCWTAESRNLAVETPSTLEEMTHLDEAGHPACWRRVPGRQAITRSDNHDVMGIFAAGYERHQYQEWLLTTVGNILDDTLSISSAGLLRGGAIAWVEVSVPEAITTPEGVEFRPNLLATTSFDGSIATTFKRTVTATVCDNTRDLALGEKGQQVKVRHSKNSRLRLGKARDALAVVHTTAEDFAREVQALCQIPVRSAQWSLFLDGHVPATGADRQPLHGRARTLAEHKRDVLERLYRSDERVAPWTGTAFGVLQAVNTYEHHEGAIRGGARGDRNMLRTVTGDFARVDQQTWKQLEKILVNG